MFDVTVRREQALRFVDGTPVRAASAITPLASGWLIAQDDATHAAWWCHGVVERLRVFPPVGGDDVFSEAARTKRDKPDLEAACTVQHDGVDAALVLGSGSLPARTRAALVMPGRTRGVATTDLGVLYDRVGEALGVPSAARNLEGACLVGRWLRWFQRGDGATVADASVDVELAALVRAVLGGDDGADVPIGAVHRYALDLAGDPVHVTDAVALRDGRVLVSAAAEDTPDPVADGPVTASGLVLLDGEVAVAAAALPRDPDGEVRKVEGLAVVTEDERGVDLLAVADQDDHELPSPALRLRVTGLPTFRARSSRG